MLARTLDATDVPIMSTLGNNHPLFRFFLLISDTLFQSLNQPFAFPDPREIAQAANNAGETNSCIVNDVE